MPGVGKTELVLQAADRALRCEGWFPGGVLFVDLSGYDSERRLTPEQALAGFLRALGVPAGHVPADAQERARLYATILRRYADAGRRLLVVLDNAASAEDVRLLLPSDGATVVLITSRHMLGVSGARTHRLVELEAAEAVALLADGLTAGSGGSDTRVADAPESAAEIARLCGYLPLALQIVTALLADQPDKPLAAMAHDLAEARAERLDELERDEAGVRAAFHLSYRRLDDRQALLFRLLPINGGPDVAVRTAAVLLDVREPVARRTLEALHRAHLVERGPVYGRWRMHDLLRLYANERGWEDSEKDRRGQATRRLLEFYAVHVRDAEAHITGRESAEGLFPDRARAIDWLEAELPNLVAATDWATERELWGFVLRLALRLPRFFELRRHLDAWTLTALAGWRAAKALGEEGLPAATLNLGQAFAAAGRHDEALPTLEIAAALHRAADDLQGEANAANASGLVMMAEGRLAEAYEQFSAAAVLLARGDDGSAVAQVEVNRATCLARMGREGEARELLSRAIAAFRREGDVRHEAGALLNLTVMSFGGEEKDHHLGPVEAGLVDDEIGTCRRAIAVFEEAGDEYGAAIATVQLGRLLRLAGDHRAAAGMLGKAVAAFHRTGEGSLEAESLGEQGLCFAAGGKHRRALESYRKAESIFADLNDQGGRGRMLFRIAVAYDRMRRPEAAMTAYRQAADAHAAAKDSQREALAQLALAEQLGTVGRLRESVRATHRAALLLAGARNDSAQAAVSSYATVLRRARAALDGPSIHSEALALFAAPEDAEPPDPAAPSGPRTKPDLAVYRARTLLSFGMLRNLRGESAQAEAYYEEAGRLFEALGSDHFVAVVANNLGGCLAAQGKHEQALAACESALRRYRALAERDGEAQALMQLAAPLGGSGRYQEAETALLEAIEIFESLGDTQRFAAMNNLGTLCEDQGRLEAAALWYGRSARGKFVPAAENLHRITEAGRPGGTSPDT